MIYINVDFSHIDGWKNVEEEIFTTKHWQNIDTLKAKNVVELEDWKIHNVYKEVEDKGEKFLSVRWVITPKYKDKNIEYKASLVARGFEIHEIHKDFHT